MEIRGNLNLNENSLEDFNVDSATGSFPTAKEGKLVYRSDLSNLFVCVQVTPSPVWFPLASPSAMHVHEQNIGSNVWNINHALGSSDVFVQVYDTSGYQLIPGEIKIVDADWVQIQFSSIETGKCLIAMLSDSGMDLEGFASSGANSDITSLSGLTTPLSKEQGGTGGTTGAATYEYDLITDYGAACDALYGYDGVATASDATFNSVTAAWVAGDVGKTIIVHGCGTNGLNHETTIASINSPTSIELTAAPAISLIGCEYTYGTDDAASYQAFLDSTNSTEWDTALWMFKLKGTSVLNIPANKISLIATPVTATSKDDILITGGGTIVFADIKAFSLTSCRRVIFSNIMIDGMTYDSPNFAPTDNTFIYIDHTDYTSFEHRSRHIAVKNCKFKRMKHLVAGGATWNGVELIVLGCLGTGYSVKNSVAIKITNMSDSIIYANTISGFEQILTSNIGGELVAHNHFYNDYGRMSEGKTGNTTISTNRIDGISAIDIDRLRVGKFYKISAGFPSSSTYYKISAKGADYIDLVDESGAAVNATSSEIGVVIQLHTASYLVSLSGCSHTIINCNSLDNAEIAEILLTNCSDIGITDNKFFKTLQGFESMFMLKIVGSGALTGIVYKNNIYQGTIGTANATVDIDAGYTSRVNCQFGPNMVGSFPTTDNQWDLSDNLTINDWHYDITEGRIGFGTKSPLFQYETVFTGSALSQRRGFCSTHYLDGTAGALYTSKRARGTEASPAALQSGDKVGIHDYAGYDGTNYQIAARIVAEVDGAVSTGVVPMALVFLAGTASYSTERMRIKSSGVRHMTTMPPIYADNAAAKAGGLVDGDEYRTADGVQMIVYT